MSYLPAFDQILDSVSRYFETLGALPRDVHVTDGGGRPMRIDEAFDRIITDARSVHAAGNKLMFIGNGGSAGIASHLAIDYSKNGNLRALAFNDAAALTCLANDLGYENVFATQIDLHARPGDHLIAISSSGASANILRGVEAARRRDCGVVTLSGFKADNPLRGLGDVNFYVPHDAYGFVEIAHLALCHAVLDLTAE
jgi:D-sedoheptulose 7-phosphate isomerase